MGSWIDIVGSWIRVFRGGRRWRAVALGDLGNVEAGGQLGRKMFLLVEIATATRRGESRRIASAASLEVSEAFGELGFERLQVGDLLARGGELLPVDLAHLGHRARGGRGGF